MNGKIVIICERYGLKRIGGPNGMDVSNGSSFMTESSYDGHDVVAAVADLVKSTAANIRKMEIFFVEG